MARLPCTWVPRASLLRPGFIAATLILGTSTAHAQGLKVIANEPAHRVDITWNGRPFTSYIWPSTLMKPVLYPLLTPAGTIVSRGYPLQPRPGERVDHPHHAGMWFNYGNVNGFDFWNNSTAIKPEDKPKYGTIGGVHILDTKSGPNSGSLTVETTWTSGKGEPLLKDITHLVFTHRASAAGPVNIIDRTTTLTALDRAVFDDDKEGLLGIRVAHFLESPTEKGGVFNDANGVPTRVDAADTSGATGIYLTSEGKQGDAVWGTRGTWCVLNGTMPDGKPASIAIFDNPSNPGAPTYWHARGYGLFAANPLGASIFDPKAPPLRFTLEKGASATFRYRVVFADHTINAPEANRESAAFRALK